MSVQKIAIAIPPETLKRVDRWAKQESKSRSRFIAEQLEYRLAELEDAEVTRLYDEAADDEQAQRENQTLATEIGRLAPDDAW